MEEHTRLRLGSGKHPSTCATGSNVQVFGGQNVLKNPTVWCILNVIPFFARVTPTSAQCINLFMATQGLVWNVMNIGLINVL